MLCVLGVYVFVYTLLQVRVKALDRKTVTVTTNTNVMYSQQLLHVWCLTFQSIPADVKILEVCKTTH